MQEFSDHSIGAGANSERPDNLYPNYLSEYESMPLNSNSFSPSMNNTVQELGFPQLEITGNFQNDNELPVDIQLLPWKMEGTFQLPNTNEQPQSPELPELPQLPQLPQLPEERGCLPEEPDIWKETPTLPDDIRGFYPSPEYNEDPGIMPLPKGSINDARRNREAIGATVHNDIGGDSNYPTLEGWIGKQIKDISPETNPRLGCALAVSSALHEMYPEIPVTVNNKVLEDALKKNGYELVEPGNEINDGDLQAGDVLIGKRPYGMPGHASIYLGNGKLMENNSDTGTIVGNGDLNKFNRGMHNADGSWNKNGFNQVLILRKSH